MLTYMGKSCGLALLLFFVSGLATAGAVPPESEERTPGATDSAAPAASGPERAAHGEKSDSTPALPRPRASPSKLRRTRQWFVDRGISGHVALTSDWSKNFRGGACTRGSAYRQLLKTSLTLDTEKSLGWKGGTAFASLHNYTGRNGGNYTGDAQGFSNIDAEPRTHLYEFWFQQELLGRRLRLKAGQVDANTEFAVVENGGDFLNSSMGYSPTIVEFPTYPQPRLGINVFFQPNQRYYAGLGLYDTEGPGAMPIVEVGSRWRQGESELPGRLGVGFWRQTGKLPRFDGNVKVGTGGFYFVLDQAVWKSRTEGAGGAQRLAAFLQYGRGDAEISSFAHHLGGGIVWGAPLGRRPNDSFGLGATWVRFSEHPAAGFEREGELTLEAFYKFQIARFLSISPDLQFIHNPGGVRSQPDCVVATPRLTISF